MYYIRKDKFQVYQSKEKTNLSKNPLYTFSNLFIPHFPVDTNI